jgi:hypothetical protein
MKDHNPTTIDKYAGNVISEEPHSKFHPGWNGVHASGMPVIPEKFHYIA